MTGGNVIKWPLFSTEKAHLSVQNVTQEFKNNLPYEVSKSGGFFVGLQS